MEKDETIIRTEGLFKRYGSGASLVVPVNNISIEVPAGRMTILQGKSGSGKTSLMNLLGALDAPDEGHIWFGGEDITRLADAARDKMRRSQMGFVFQSVALMGDMTAFENVDFQLRIAGMPAALRKARATECLELVGLAGRMHHLPQELSGGEQQRVAIARAIAHQPAVLFADEPTAQLDTIIGLQVLHLFLELVEKEGVTLVMTTHDPEIVSIAHKVYTLKDGEVADGH